MAGERARLIGPAPEAVVAEALAKVRTLFE